MDNKIKLHKRSFSLLELMIVMLLILISLGGTMIYVPNILRKEAFEKSVSQLVSKISLAQEFMIDYGVDITVKLEQKSEGIEVLLIPKQTLTTPLSKALNQYHLLKGIKSFSFNGQKVSELTLLFDGKMGKTPQGTLHIEGRSSEASFILKGYLCALSRGEFKDDENQATYPEEILSAL